MQNAEPNEEIVECPTISVTMPKSDKLIFENELSEEVLKSEYLDSSKNEMLKNINLFQKEKNVWKKEKGRKSAI